MLFYPTARRVLRHSFVLPLLMTLGATDPGRADTDAGNLMLVFDASGSMWGQIEGRTKIEIARDAFAEAQQSWDAEALSTGLIAYGHRRKGDCADIEVRVPLGQSSGGQIAADIQTLRPKGKTPLSDAIRLAAGEMRYREDAATVVLFSDGIETCDADPCALAAELERDGIDFTAHVIGFGLGGDTDRSQLACIAENTGGQFIEAQDASTLRDALQQVANAPAPEPETPPSAPMIAVRVTVAEAEGTVRPQSVGFRATDMATGDKRMLGRVEGTEQVITGLATELPAGQWTIEAISDEGGGTTVVEVSDATTQIDVPFTANDADFVLIDMGPYRPGIEHTFFLGVTDPLQAGAEYTVSLYPAGATEFGDRIDWETRFGSEGAGFTSHSSKVPDTPGDYEIIVFRGYELSEANARFPIRVEADAPIRWLGDRAGEPGGALPLRISGDAYTNNAVSLRGDDGTEVFSKWLGDTLVTEDGPMLQLPEKPGLYRLSYRATSEAEPIDLGQITVGDVQRADDPDAVAPPMEDDAKADPAPAAAPTGSAVTQDVVLSCQDDPCRYTNPAIGVTDVPLFRSFQLANPALTDEGRPSFDIYSAEAETQITLNPLRMVNTMECIGLTADGARADDTQPLDVLCIGGNPSTAAANQFEAIEAWRAAENAKVYAATLEKDRAAHDATMGGDGHFGTGTLDRAWSMMDTTTQDVVGMIAFDLSPSGQGGTAQLQLMPSGATGVSAPQQVQLDITPITDGDGALVSLMGSGDGATSLQLLRPPNWDGADNVFEGLLLIGATGKTLRVRMF